MESLHVQVVSPDRTAYEGDASSVVAPAWDGRVGILRGHAPMITLLGSGKLVIDQVGGGSVTYHVAGGVLKVEDDRVTLLTEYAGDRPPDVLPEGARIDPEDLGVFEFPSSPADPLV